MTGDGYRPERKRRRAFGPLPSFLKLRRARPPSPPPQAPPETTRASPAPAEASCKPILRPLLLGFGILLADVVLIVFAVSMFDLVRLEHWWEYTFAVMSMAVVPLCAGYLVLLSICRGLRALFSML